MCTGDRCCGMQGMARDKDAARRQGVTARKRASRQNQKQKVHTSKLIIQGILNQALDLGLDVTDAKKELNELVYLADPCRKATGRPKRAKDKSRPASAPPSIAAPPSPAPLVPSDAVFTPSLEPGSILDEVPTYVVMTPPMPPGRSSPINKELKPPHRAAEPTAFIGKQDLANFWN